MKLLRNLVGIFVGLILLCVLGAIFLLIFVDPNKLKPVLKAYVSKQTGYQLMIDGNLSWSFYPKMGIKVTHLMLLAPKETSSKQPLVEAQNVAIAMSVKSLLHGEYKFSGNIHIAHLTLIKLKAENAYVGVHFQDGNLTLQPITAHLYSGKLEGVMHGREFSKNSRWDWNMHLRDVAIKPLLADVNGSDAKLKIAGTAFVGFSAATQGITQEQILKNLHGSGQFNVKNGMLSGIDLNYFVQNADALINKHALLPLSDSKNNTAFNQLTGTLQIQQGIASNHDFLLTSSEFITKGEGDVNLVNQMLNYRLQVIPSHRAKVTWFVPLLLKGSLQKPSVRLDADRVNQVVAEEQMTKVKMKVQEEINKLPEKANKFLQKLLER